MSRLRSKITLAMVTGTLACLMVLSTPYLTSHIRFGLEFRGGYEIYYVVSPGHGKTEVTKADLIETGKILRQRADSIGMAEPDIHIEGENHIRVKLAGLTSEKESRSLLGSSDGLPTVLTEKYTQTVGSVLGKTALKETVTAGAIGICLIFLILLFLYRGMGLIAVFCTMVYFWILIILFNASHATLTLSAVVAFVLGVGMAADASIICFERVKEELSRGIAARDAVRQGFIGSFPTIRDANLVTALAMLALFIAGIGPIQGFSLTMLVSIVISIGTNFFGVRRLSLWLVDSGFLSPEMLVSGAMVEKRKTAFFNFVGFGGIVILISALTILSGALYYRVHGLNLDIDFTAGTALDIDLDRSITLDAATKLISDSGTIPDTVAIGGKTQNHIAARFEQVLKPEQLKKIVAVFQAKYKNVVYEENTADPGVARDFAKKAVYAVLAAFGSIAIYIGFRFSWSIAFATLLSIIQDVLMVSAIFSLFKLEIDVTYIAALLTIIGYSLNDKIVIFGRIRENIHKLYEEDEISLSHLVNTSIRQTLRRSVFTVLTVAIASACLYLFACEPLQMFSLAILIGLVSGACSSIFMTTVLWLTIRRKMSESPEQAPLASRRFITAISIMVLAVVIGWYAIPMSKETKPDQALTVTGTKKGGLGDLSPYIQITNDTKQFVENNDFKGAKTRIKDLETAWDDAEEKTRPINPVNWFLIDKAIDRALKMVRSGSPDKGECLSALKALIEKLNSIQS